LKKVEEVKSNFMYYYDPNQEAYAEIPASTEPYKYFEPYEEIDGPSILRYLYFTQMLPLIESGVPMPDDFAEVIDYIDVNTPLSEEEIS